MTNNWTILHAKLHQVLRQRQLLPQGSGLLVAVSGGQDSLCLGKLLLDLQPKWEWQIAIAHCDHRWSTDAGIAEHVAEITASWQVPFYLKVAAEKLPETEAAARQWRYQALTEIAQEQGFSFLVTGHTQSDRAETLLYNLIRGAGADGLVALSWQRALTEQIQLVRPLLDVSRSETGVFCQQQQLPIWEDSANSDLHYARNRLRQEVIPYLQTHFNPNVETTLAQTVEILTAEVTYLEDFARKIYHQALSHDGLALDRSSLQVLPLAIQRRVMRLFLQALLNKAPNFPQIEALTQLINAPNRSRTSTLPKGAVVEVQQNWLVWQSKNT